MIKLLTTVILTGYSFLLTIDCNASSITSMPIDIENGRAISLKALQKKAKDCRGDVLYLCDIKKVLGFVIDKKKDDIILIGETDKNSPPLQLEDFIIALRNEWMIYAEKGTTHHYSPPGCTIDPDPKVLKELQQIADRKDSVLTPELAYQRVNQWYEACQKPRKVKVFGVPHNSHFSKVMVDADYHMKKISNDLVTLNVNGFMSPKDLRINNAKNALNNNRQIAIPTQNINRFWFYPEENDYLENKGSVFIKKCRVKLLTEKEYLTKKGTIVASGQIDTFAQKYADNFTMKYDQIAKEEPIFAELEALYGFMTISRLIKQYDALNKANLSLEYFLKEFPITPTNVNPTLPGIPDADILRTTNGNALTLSCGGVLIDMSSNKILNKVEDDTLYLEDLSNRIFKKVRLFPKALYWNF